MEGSSTGDLRVWLQKMIDGAADGEDGLQAREGQASGHLRAMGRRERKWLGGSAKQ